MDILNKSQIENLRKSGRILAESMLLVKNAIKPGITTLQLDQIAENAILERNARPSFKNYHVLGVGTYPSALCISINDEIVHGIPNKNRILEEGDIVSLDLGAEFNGIYSDMAITVGVGKISPIAEKLIKTTKESLERGIQSIKIGNTINTIGRKIEAYVLENGFDVVREYVGHGIGTKPHTDPQIPNFDDSYATEIITNNTALAIEPMVVTGDFRTYVTENGWTVRTIDGGLSAHFEHTVLIENNKPTIVTIA